MNRFEEEVARNIQQARTLTRLKRVDSAKAEKLASLIHSERTSVDNMRAFAPIDLEIAGIVLHNWEVVKKLVEGEKQ